MHECSIHVCVSAKHQPPSHPPQPCYVYCASCEYLSHFNYCAWYEHLSHFASQPLCPMYPQEQSASLRMMVLQVEGEPAPAMTDIEAAGSSPFLLPDAHHRSQADFMAQHTPSTGGSPAQAVADPGAVSGGVAGASSSRLRTLLMMGGLGSSKLQTSTSNTSLGALPAGDSMADVPSMGLPLPPMALTSSATNGQGANRPFHTIDPSGAASQGAGPGMGSYVAAGAGSSQNSRLFYVASRLSTDEGGRDAVTAAAWNVSGADIVAGAGEPSNVASGQQGTVPPLQWQARAQAWLENEVVGEVSRGSTARDGTAAGTAARAVTPSACDQFMLMNSTLSSISLADGRAAAAGTPAQPPLHAVQLMYRSHSMPGTAAAAPVLPGGLDTLTLPDEAIQGMFLYNHLPAADGAAPAGGGPSGGLGAASGVGAVPWAVHRAGGGAAEPPRNSTFVDWALLMDARDAYVNYHEVGSTYNDGHVLDWLVMCMVTQ